MGQRITIAPVTRIEGHARIVIDLDDAGQVSSGHLQVLEIRGFEKLLQGMELFKMPQVTARLCGVCPAAHHLAAVLAIEKGLGITVPVMAQQLRELLYLGHVLHSHALSNFVLSGPDILLGLASEPDARNIFSVLRTDPELAKKILRVRSIGQRTVEAVGGRGVHPVTAVPGGMAMTPDRERLELIAGWGREATKLLEEIGKQMCEQMTRLDPLRTATTMPLHSLALSNDGSHTMFEGTWVVIDDQGREERRFAGTEYADHLVEHVAAGSYMKSVRLRAEPEKSFFVGPLARLNVNHTFSTGQANQALAAFRTSGAPRLSAVDQISARLIEMFHCAEGIAKIASSLAGGNGHGQLAVDAEPAAGRYVGAIEAPRGILVHDYTADSEGRVTDVNLIVATQNNYDAIDHAITATARYLMPADNDDHFMNGIEFALRCFDPCLACATHMMGKMPMEIELRRAGEVVRRLIRRAAR